MRLWGKINPHLLTGVAILEISIKDSKKARNKSKVSIYLYLLPTDTCSITLISALLPIARIEKELKCPSPDEWVMKMWYIGIYTRVNTIHL